MSTNEIKWDLAELLKGFTVSTNVKSIDVTGLSLDSRNIQTGDLFFATTGIESHGLDYADMAIANGAVAVLYEPATGKKTPRDASVPCIAISDLGKKVGLIASRFYAEPSDKLFVVGVTGTNGKTSVTHMVAQALNNAGEKCGVMGTLGNGFVGELSKATHTTPNAVQVQAGLAAMLASGAKAVAMEVSSHALTQGRVNGVEFNVAVFTNLTRDHLDYHGDMKNYADAKRKLLSVSPTKAKFTAAVVNVDDDEGDNWVSAAPNPLKLVMFSTRDKQSDLFVSDVMLAGNGITCDLNWWGDSAEINVGLMGEFNLENLLACAGSLLVKGMSLNDVAESMEGLTSVPGRMQIVEFEDQDHPSVVVDFAHTPDALEKALEAMRAHCEGKVICVFGCGGDRDAGKRPIMAQVAEQMADQVIVTDDNPRTEDPTAIMAGITAGFETLENVQVIHDRKDAIAKAIAMAQMDDCVLVAGKGHEQFQIIGEQKIPFSDVEVVESILGEVKS